MESLFAWNLNSLLVYLEPLRIVEVVASLLSCWGAYRVANYGHARQAVLGWAAWLLAGLLWVIFAAVNTYWFMGITQAYFLYTAWLGFGNSRRSPKSVSQDELKGVQHG